MDNSSVKTVIRTKHDKENPYVMIIRVMPQNKGLSYEAVGLLTYLLSKPDDWKVIIGDLQRERAGRDKIYRILNELIGCGYMTREQFRDEKGIITEVVYTAFEEPLPEKPYTAKPDTANPTLHNREENIEEKELNSEELQKVPATTSVKKAEKKVIKTGLQLQIERGLVGTVTGFTELDKPPKKIWTALEDRLLHNSSATKISDAQRNQLDEDREYMLGNPPDYIRVPSANDLYDSNPEFKKFADERIAYLKSENVKAVGTMIDQICNYESKKGWFFHERIAKPQSLPEVGNIPTEEPIMGGWLPTQTLAEKYGVKIPDYVEED